MSSPPHQETAASFARAAQCLDFGGQWEKCCLLQAFVKSLRQLSRHKTATVQLALPS